MTVYRKNDQSLSFICAKLRQRVFCTYEKQQKFQRFMNNFIFSYICNRLRCSEFQLTPAGSAAEYTGSSRLIHACRPGQSQAHAVPGETGHPYTLPILLLNREALRPAFLPQNRQHSAIAWRRACVPVHNGGPAP